VRPEPPGQVIGIRAILERSGPDVKLRTTHRARGCGGPGRLGGRFVLFLRTARPEPDRSLDRDKDAAARAPDSARPPRVGQGPVRVRRVGNLRDGRLACGVRKPG
jgi:hypothetical protein